VLYFARARNGSNHIGVNECITSQFVVSAARDDIPVEGLLRQGNSRGKSERCRGGAYFHLESGHFHIQVRRVSVWCSSFMTDGSSSRFI